MSSNSSLTAAMLIISTTAAASPATDQCIPTLTEVFTEGGTQWTVKETRIVSDDVLEIQRAVREWCDCEDFVNLIVTSGGTGFAIKDVTPEAVSPLIHRHAPGLVHGMLAASLTVTPFAIMSRPVAGVRNNTLILTLPGSPKGAKENLQAVLKLLPHACTQTAGTNSRMLHRGGVENLERDAGVGSGQENKRPEVDGASHSPKQPYTHQPHHHHNHGGHAPPTAHTDPSTRPQPNDPSLGPSRRHRSSPYPMLSVSSALSLISSNIPPPMPIKLPLSQSLVGHVLAADIKAVESVPAFRASIVDGYAVQIAGHEKDAKNQKGVFPVAFASHAQAGEITVLEDGAIARITTGAPLPPSADAVVMVEDTVLRSLSADGDEEGTVEILTDALAKGENVREVGSDVKAGDVVMRKGEGISAVGGEFGLLASVGTREVMVYKKPIVGVLSTGDEIVEFDKLGDLRLGEVRDTNRPTLLTAVRAQGFAAVDLGVVSDKPASLDSTLRIALSKVDLLITTGGVSMGELDLLKPTLERYLGGTIHFGRVSMKPGKPTTFATVPGANIKDPATGNRGGSANGTKKVVFSLPGNPASAVVTFMLFVLPALHQMSGITPMGLPRVLVRMDAAVRCDASREEYHRVVVGAKTGEEGLWALSTGGQRSSRIGSFKGANALLVVPAGGGLVERGSQMEALLMGAPGGLAA